MVLVAIAAAALGTVAYATHLMRALELQSVDARFSARGSQERPEEIVVVQVDDRTFSELGVQWPFPRSLHGRVIDQLRRAGAKTVAFDVQFTEPTEPAQDNALIEAIERKPRCGALDHRSQTMARAGSSAAKKWCTRSAPAPPTPWSSPTRAGRFAK